jgi:hypothetical protein
MKINLTPDQYYYALYLAQSELIEKKNQQGSLTKTAENLYNAYESELNRIAPDRNALTIA